MGVGGKWEFIGEPSKKSQKRKFYNVRCGVEFHVSNRYPMSINESNLFHQTLRVFNGDIVAVGDDVLLSAEEDMPP